MPADQRKIRWPSGHALGTPLLVPSLSSKGFAVIQGGEDGLARSEVSDVLEMDTVVDQLHKAFLVSAYDLHHKLLAVGDSLDDPNWTASPLSLPELLIIDSGGYEAQVGTDGGELIQDFTAPREWSAELYASLLDQLPESASNCAAVAWDRPGESYEAQLRLAQEDLAPRRNLAGVALLKPPEGARFHNFRQLSAVADRLAAFSVVGVTESELGRSLLDRIVSVANLRDVLTGADLEIPIHVFGALDPLFVPSTLRPARTCSTD